MKRKPPNAMLRDTGELVRVTSGPVIKPLMLPWVVCEHRDGVLRPHRPGSIARLAGSREPLPSPVDALIRGAG